MRSTRSIAPGCCASRSLHRVHLDLGERMSRAFEDRNRIRHANLHLAARTGCPVAGGARVAGQVGGVIGRMTDDAGRGRPTLRRRWIAVEPAGQPAPGRPRRTARPGRSAPGRGLDGPRPVHAPRRRGRDRQDAPALGDLGQGQGAWVSSVRWLGRATGSRCPGGVGAATWRATMVHLPAFGTLGSRPARAPRGRRRRPRASADGCSSSISSIAIAAELDLPTLLVVRGPAMGGRPQPRDHRRARATDARPTVC